MTHLLPEQPGSNSSITEVMGSGATRWFRRSALSVGVLTATMLSGGAIYLASVNSNIERADLISTAAAAPQSAKSAINIAILGSSSPTAVSPATGEGSVVMVLHISADRRQASLVSFPSATYVSIPGEGMGMLKSTYALGGAKLTVSTLEKILDTRIDHAMVAKFAGFEALAEQVGSVSVDNPEAFTSAGVTFKKGQVQLTPAQALVYIQKGSGEADTEAQAARQRLVLEAGMQKGLSRDVLSSPTKLNRFVKTTTSNTVVDKDFTASEIAKIARSLRLSRDDATLVRAPLSDESMTTDGQQVQKVDAKQFKVLARALSDDNLDGYIEKYPTE